MADPVIIALGISITLSLLVVWWVARPQSIRAFFIGDSSLSSAESTQLFLSSSFSLNGVLYQTWLGYSIGIASLWLQVAWCASYLLLAARVEPYTTLFRDTTLHGAIRKTSTLRASQLAAVASIVGFAIQLGWELAVGVQVFASNGTGSASSSLVGWFITLILALLAATYTAMGGLKGNVVANILQNGVAVLALIALIVILLVGLPNALTTIFWIFVLSLSMWGLYAALPKLGGQSEGRKNLILLGVLTAGLLGLFGVFAHRQPVPVETFVGSHRLLLTLGVGGLLSNLAFSLVWQAVDMSAWQNIVATKPDAIVRQRSLRSSALWVFLFPGVAGALIGIALRHLDPTLNPDSVLPAAISFLWGQQGMLVLLMCGLVCAMLSTIDGVLLAATQASIWDLTDRNLVADIVQHPRPASDVEASLREDRLIGKSRIIGFVVALIGAVFVRWLVVRKVNLFDIVYVVTVAQMALVPVVATMLWQANRQSHDRLRRWATTSIAIGLLGGTAWVLAGVLRFREVTFGGSAFLDYAPVITIAIAALPLLLPGKRSAIGA